MKLHFLMTYLGTMTVFLRASDGAKVAVLIDPAEGPPRVTVMWESGRRAMSTQAAPSECAEAIACVAAIDIRTLQSFDSSPNIWEPA